MDIPEHIAEQALIEAILYGKNAQIGLSPNKITPIRFQEKEQSMMFFDLLDRLKDDLEQKSLNLAQMRVLFHPYASVPSRYGDI